MSKIKSNINKKIIVLLITIIAISISFVNVYAREVKIEEYDYINEELENKIFERSIDDKKYIKDSINEVEYYVETKNNIEYTYEKYSNNLIGYNELREGRQKTITEERAKKRISEEYSRLKFPKEYELRYLEYNDTTYTWDAKYEEKIDGIFNQYKGVKLKFSPYFNKIVQYRMFNQNIKEENKISNITKEDLKKDINDYKVFLDNLKTNNELKIDINLDKVEEVYIKPNNFFDKNKKRNLISNKVIRSWKVPITENMDMYINSNTGNIIGGDELKYAEALSSSTGFFSVLDIVTVNNLADGFQRLGYKTFTRDKDATNFILKDWIYRGGSQYAFYISTHGSVLDGKVFFVDKEKNKWFPENIKGNWDFVFIDACYSKANDTMANGFKIYNGSKKKAYLGWKDSVGIMDASVFDMTFASKLGSAPIQKVAADIANNMPSYVPIRFVGDKGWYGYAR